MRGDDEQKPPEGDGATEGRPADSSSRKARTLIFLVAGCCFLVGGLDLAAYLAKCQHDHASVNLLRCLWLSIPLVVGAVILVKTSALAAWIEDWLDQ